jgi:small subunit ribosomal protein S10
MLMNNKIKTQFKIQLKSVDKKSLYFFIYLLKKVFEKTNIVYSNINLPIKKKILTLLKSPHVNKSAREQFELRAYKSVLIIKSKVSYEFIKILFKNKPQTVNIVIKQLGR